MSLVNIWQNLQEELQLNILSYLNAIDLITVYVSKYFRTLVLKKLYKDYDISTGFWYCSTANNLIFTIKDTKLCVPVVTYQQETIKN